MTIYCKIKAPQTAGHPLDPACRKAAESLEPNGAHIMIDNRTAPYAALILRVALGVMFLAHGLLKVFVFTLPGTAGFFASVGIPGWMAYPVVAAEIAGGALLVLGVYTRVVAALLIPVLVGAASVHLGNGWVFSNAKGGWEYPVFLIVIAAVVALLGDGAHALKPFTTSERNRSVAGRVSLA
jgi:putative oxidoreductase